MSASATRARRWEANWRAVYKQGDHYVTRRSNSFHKTRELALAWALRK